jgi:hypothetical protein
MTTVNYQPSKQVKGASGFLEYAPVQDVRCVYAARQATAVSALGAVNATASPAPAPSPSPSSAARRWSVNAVVAAGAAALALIAV